jgi:uncharacterized protein YhfF
MKNASTTALWEAYLDEFPGQTTDPEPAADHFGHTEEIADSCAELVLRGIKRRTSQSLLGLQHRGERLPKMGDLNIVTDWNGQAHCIIKTVKVRLKPFFSVSAEDARLEGEGDGSLEYWRQSHWEYYTRELEAFGKKPVQSMIVVCEEFEKIFELPR